MTGQWLHRSNRIKHQLKKGHLVRYFKIREYLNSNAVRKLHLAPGELPVKQPGWLTADIWTGDVYFNALKKLPFKNSSIDYAFSEHFLEHLSYEQTVKHLHEIYRVLKPGGIIRISMPDLEAICKAYVNKDKRVLESFLKLQQRIVPDIKKPIYKKRHKMLGSEFLNTSFIGFGHKYLWDFEALDETVKALGFDNIKRYKEKQSNIDELKGLERHSEQDSLNSALTFSLEAQKPLKPIKAKTEYSDTVNFILTHK